MHQNQHVKLNLDGTTMEEMSAEEMGEAQEEHAMWPSLQNERIY